MSVPVPQDPRNLEILSGFGFVVETSETRKYGWAKIPDDWIDLRDPLGGSLTHTHLLDETGTIRYSICSKLTLWDSFVTGHVVSKEDSERTLKRIREYQEKQAQREREEEERAQERARVRREEEEKLRKEEQDRAAQRCVDCGECEECHRQDEQRRQLDKLKEEWRIQRERDQEIRDRESALKRKREEEERERLEKAETERMLWRDRILADRVERWVPEKRWGVYYDAWIDWLDPQHRKGFHGFFSTRESAKDASDYLRDTKGHYDKIGIREFEEDEIPWIEEEGFVYVNGFMERRWYYNDDIFQ